jgi:diguanylate cyclase (GGDEF)-like protein/PAS domain S-box-containing protein
MSDETILIVDDNRQIANFIAHKVVPELGYQSLVAYNGKTAYEIIKANQVSLMILDLQLPDTTGLEFLRRLSSEGINIPTILSTAHGSEQVAADAFRLGVEDYLPKPVQAEILNEAITRALSESRLRREKATLTTRLQEQLSWYKVLSRVGQSLTSTLETDEVLRRIVDAGVLLTQADEGFLAILDEGGKLFMRAVKNIDADRVKTMRLPVQDSLLGKVIQSGKPVRTSKSSEKPSLKVTTGYLVHSLLHIPIFSKGVVVGVLSVDNQFRRRTFTDRDEMILTSLADYAAIALENADLYQNAQQEIAHRQQIEAALRESEERYALAMRGANDGLWDWDMRTNEVYFSSRWKSMLGYGDDEITARLSEWFSRVHSEDIERLKLDISSHIKGLTPHLVNEHRMMHKDGAYRWMLSRGFAIRTADEAPYRMAGSLTDTTDRKFAEEKLLQNAFYDGLTKLANRALFMENLRFAVERVKRRSEYQFAVLFLDLDRFKNINDSLGHMMGDKLLIDVARRIENRRRATDTVARLGGDEFVILLDDISELSAVTYIADGLLESLAEPYQLGGHDVQITTSIGIVLSASGYERPEDVLRDADIAMYSAKASGKARYEIFDPVMRKRILERLELETELRKALTSQELRVYYQPIVSLVTQSIIGFEALARWPHAKLGFLTPNQFIPLAEDTGLIIPLDRFVLREACRQMAEWHKQLPFDPPLTISVNLSGKQIVQSDLIETIEKILIETGLAPQYLKLEITENVILEDNQLTVEVFRELQKLGVQVQIDDFGVGYSSLNYLSQFPINALKIDQSFVGQMLDDNNQLEIIQAIVMLTHRLGVGVIAEGMETTGQMDTLKSMGCEFGQGYLVSVPLDNQSAQKILEHLIQHPTDILGWKNAKK